MFGSNNKDRRTSHNDNVNDLTHEQTEKGKRKREEAEGKRKREEIGKERANKTAKVKWGRGKREANNVNAREMGL